MWNLPNPFLDEKGSVVPAAEWKAQQERLRTILAEDFYGKCPPAPGNVRAEKVQGKELWDGSACFEVYDLSFGPEQSVCMKTALIRPKEKKAYPIVLCGGSVDEDIAKMAVEKGFLIATPLMDDAAPDQPDYQKGTLYQAYPEAGFKVIAMWGWLLSRVIDWLETTDFIEKDSFSVAGHSRYGKAALACVVNDERVRVCCAAGSGCGGMGSLRYWGSRFGAGTGKVETLGSMVKNNFPHWFADTLGAYGADEASEHSRENELRFDANFIASVIAPRPLIVLEGLDDTWANPMGTIASWSAAAEVYHYLGSDENCAIHFREGGHAFNLEDWKVFLSFAREKLTGEKEEKTWRIREANDPKIGRDWSAPGSEEEPAPEEGFAATPEAVARLKKMLEKRWAFAEFGLETGMSRFLKEILRKMSEEKSPD